MFPYKVITDFEQAEEYRENLTAQEEQYLQSVDRFTGSIAQGEKINLDKFVKPANFEAFWLAFSYVLLACGLDVSLSDDYLTVCVYRMGSVDGFKIAA